MCHFYCGQVMDRCACSGSSCLNRFYDMFMTHLWKGENLKQFNILNRDRKPQPLFKVELELKNKPLKKYEVHPIYNFQFLRNRTNAMVRYNMRAAKNMPIQGHTLNCAGVCTLWRASWHCPTSKDDFNSNKEERYSQIPRLSDTRYSAKGTEGKWRYASSKARLKCATYRR